MVKDINTFNIIKVNCCYGYRLEFVTCIDIVQLLPLRTKNFPNGRQTFIGILPSATGMSQYLEQICISFIAFSL